MKINVNIKKDTEQKNEKFRQEFNEAPLREKFQLLRTLFNDAICFRQDAWFHYSDAKTAEILDEYKLRQFSNLLKTLEENNGKIPSIK